MANDVRVVVRADTGGARQEIRDFGEELKGGLFNASNIAKGALLGLGAAGVGAFGGAVKIAADFEHSLSQVGAVANATESEMAGLRAEALKIGADTAFSASQAASAMEVLAANGVSARDIMGGAARAAADLAAAGGTDLVTAANIASTAMAVWGMKTEDLTNVVNRLAGAANTSRFGVEDMGLAIAQGGGVAAAAGVSFNDFAASIAATAQYFSSGADAGTSFKTFLVALSGNSEKAKQTMQELGLEFYDAQGKLKPMSAIVQELHDKLGPLSEAQQTVALKTIFGNDAYRTAAGLMKMTGAEFEELSRKMGSTNAADVAAQRMGNLKGNVEQLKGSLETMAIGVGSMVLPALTEMAGGATQAVNVLAGLPSSTQATALAFGAISIAAPAAVKAVQSLTAAFQALRTGSASLGMSLSGIGLAIGGVAVAADLILQKTSGHGLFEWLFGDVAGAERNARAAAELEARIRAAGQGADAVAISMQHLREKTDAWAAAQAELNRIQQEGLPLYQQNAAVQAAAQAMTEAEASVRAAAQAMKDHNVDALEMARVYNDLPPKLRAVFDEVTGITQVMGTQEFAMWSAATVTDGWRS
ncbi:phage tail tape measure protein, partial [Tepidiforma sp.]|uniref:phage tail tape measure protein n=1 Tax=Tepidiforma sp. TaxID=2682230 RepID=UPI00262F7034